LTIKSTSHTNVQNVLTYACHLPIPPPSGLFLTGLRTTEIVITALLVIQIMPVRYSIFKDQMPSRLLSKTPKIALRIPLRKTTFGFFASALLRFRVTSLLRYCVFITGGPG